MKKIKKFQPPKKKQPFFSFVKIFLRPFYKRPKVVYCGEKIRDGSIIVANHCSMKGPVIYEMYLPAFHAKWGAGEMLGNFKSRFRYLRDVYFMQKSGYKRPAASFLAFFDALFSIYFYRGMKFLPTWRDARFAKTVINSVDVLQDGTSVLIFPENSEEGYKEVLTEFFPGFVILAEKYFKKTQTDVPIYPVYYSDRANLMIIGEPTGICEYLNRGLDRVEIAEEFRRKVNELYFQYIEPQDLAA